MLTGNRQHFGVLAIPCYYSPRADVKRFTNSRALLVAEVGLGTIRAAALALEFGFIVGAFIGTGSLLGSHLDSVLGSSPWLLVLGILLGLGCSAYSMYLIYKWQK